MSTAKRDCKVPVAYLSYVSEGQKMVNIMVADSQQEDEGVVKFGPFKEPPDVPHGSRVVLQDVAMVKNILEFVGDHQHNFFAPVSKLFLAKYTETYTNRTTSVEEAMVSRNRMYILLSEMESGMYNICLLYTSPSPRD